METKQKEQEKALTSRELREELRALLTRELRKLPELIKQMPPMERVKTILQLMPYCTPKEGDPDTGVPKMDFGW